MVFCCIGNGLCYFPFFRNKSTLTEKLALGEKVPELVLCNESQPLNLRAAEGGYLLLSFWASYDAVSRREMQC